jgi:hypothetical protein
MLRRFANGSPRGGKQKKNSMRLIQGFIIASAAQMLLLGDIVQCENGDRYTGKVLLVNEAEVRLLNEIHGALTVPRSRVSSIQFQPQGQTNRVSPPAGVGLNATSGGLQIDSAAVQKVQTEILGTANPEANQLFQEMIQGLAGGTLNLGDIRVQAKQTLDQVRELQKDLGDDDTAGLLNSYVSILENFVKQTTNAPPPKQVAPKPAAVAAEN